MATNKGKSLGFGNIVDAAIILLMVLAQTRYYVNKIKRIMIRGEDAGF